MFQYNIWKGTGKKEQIKINSNKRIAIEKQKALIIGHTNMANQLNVSNIYNIPTPSCSLLLDFSKNMKSQENKQKLDHYFNIFVDLRLQTYDQQTSPD